MPISSKKALKLLEKDGWYIHTTNGSHIKLKKDGNNLPIILPLHNTDLTIGVQRQIEKICGFKLDRR